MKTLNLLFSALLLAGATVATTTVHAEDHGKKETTHGEGHGDTHGDTHGGHGDHKEEKGAMGGHDDHDKDHGKGEKHSAINSRDEMRASMGSDQMGSTHSRERGDQITEELNQRNLQQGSGNQQQMNQRGQGAR